MRSLKTPAAPLPLPLWRIVAIATAAEFCIASVILALLGAVGGLFSGWLDVLNQLCAAGLLVGLVGMGLAWTAPRGRTRYGLMGCAAVTVLISVILLTPDALVAARGLGSHPVKGDRPLKIVQCNIWTENEDLPHAAKVLRAADADIIVLEEMDYLHLGEIAELRQTYPFKFDCLRCGVMILSRTRPVSIEDLTPKGPPGPSDLGLVKAVFTAPDGRPFTLYGTHLPWPFPPPLQRGLRAQLGAQMAKAPAADTILVGDFNLSGGSNALRDMDAKARPLIRQTHLLQTYPALVPRARFPWPTPFLSIDQIYASPSWRVSDLHRLPRVGSDHYPIMATFTR